MKKWNVLWVLVSIMVGIQFIRPKLDTPPITADIQAPGEVGQILRRACYNCHSNETHLKWFDVFAPAYWIVASDVKQARKTLNFSEWDKLMPPQQKAILYMSLNQILFKEMPLWQYSLLHPEAKLEESDIAVLKNYLKSLTPYKISDTARINAGHRQYNNWMLNHTIQGNVQSAPNGIEYIDGYNNWKAISTTNRFDNGTMRVIFGNEIAVSHARSDAENPYLQGAVLSLVTWKQHEDKHWFGARIPQQIQSIELIKFVAFENNMVRTVYENYEGSPLRLNKENSPAIIAGRTAYITSQKASVIP